MWNLDEYCKLILKSVRLRPLLWKFLITGAMFWFVFWYTQARLLFGWKVSRDQLVLSLNLGIFRTDYQTPANLPSQDQQANLSHSVQSNQSEQSDRFYQATQQSTFDLTQQGKVKHLP